MIFKLFSDIASSPGSQVEINPGDLDIPQPPGGPNNTSPLEASLPEILRLVFGIAGSIAVLIIIYAGIQFMLSRGDPQKSATARNAVIYAAVGLLIAALAFNIVGFFAGRI